MTGDSVFIALVKGNRPHSDMDVLVGSSFPRSSNGYVFSGKNTVR